MYVCTKDILSTHNAALRTHWTVVSYPDPQAPPAGALAQVTLVGLGMRLTEQWHVLEKALCLIVASLQCLPAWAVGREMSVVAWRPWDTPRYNWKGVMQVFIQPYTRLMIFIHFILLHLWCPQPATNLHSSLYIPQKEGTGSVQSCTHPLLCVSLLACSVLPCDTCMLITAKSWSATDAPKLSCTYIRTRASSGGGAWFCGPWVRAHWRSPPSHPSNRCYRTQWYCTVFIEGAQWVAFLMVLKSRAFKTLTHTNVSL